jgi:hypothetical protein
MGRTSYIYNIAGGGKFARKIKNISRAGTRRRRVRILDKINRIYRIYFNHEIGENKIEKEHRIMQAR